MITACKYLSEKKQMLLSKKNHLPVSQHQSEHFLIYAKSKAQTLKTDTTGIYRDCIKDDKI